MIMVNCGWSVEPATERDEWRYASEDCGVPSVMTAMTHWTQLSYAGSWDSSLLVSYIRYTELRGGSLTPL